MFESWINSVYHYNSWTRRTADLHRIVSLSCHLLACPAEKVWYHAAAVYPSDSWAVR